MSFYLGRQYLKTIIIASDSLYNFYKLLIDKRILEVVVFLFFIEFTGVTLINKIIQVLGVQFYSTSSVHCIVCSPPQVKSPSTTIYPPILFPSSSL